MRLKPSTILVALFLTLGASTLSAQVRFGGQLDWGSDSDFGLGARALFPIGDAVNVRGLDISAAFDYFFPSHPAGTDLTYWEINGNALYNIQVRNTSLAPYVGAGLNIAHASAGVTGFGSASNTDAGLNLVGGSYLRLRNSRIMPFAEARVILGGGDQFVLSGGVVF